MPTTLGYILTPNPMTEVQANLLPNCSSFIAGGVAACGAVTATHGFETVKIR
jgi:hypothetical protein